MLNGDILIGGGSVAGRERSYRAIDPATGKKPVATGCPMTVLTWSGIASVSNAY